MLDRRYQEILDSIRQGRSDDETWIRLAREVARHRPEELPVTLDDLEDLLELWGRHPRERSLEHLVLPLMDLELPPRCPREPAAWWARQPAIVACEDHWFHLETGQPLTVRRPKDGALMTRLKIRSPLYVDHHPVTAGRYRHFLEATGGELPSGWKAADLPDDAAAVLLSYPEASAYAEWVGGFVADDRLWSGVAELNGVPPLPDHPAGKLAEILPASRVRSGHPLLLTLPRIPPPEEERAYRVEFSLPLFEWNRIGTSSQGGVPPTVVTGSGPGGFPTPLPPGARRLEHTRAARHPRLGFRVFTKLDPTGKLRLRLST